MTSNNIGNVTASDGARVHNGDYHNHFQTPDTCLADLRLTDPRDDKTSIEKANGNLQKNCYRWILKNYTFKQWRDGGQSRLLLITAEPGKGKTMLVCGIIDQLMKQSTYQVCYFFCQNTDERMNTATAVLRGLIFLLIEHQPVLISHIQKKYNSAGKALFEDKKTAWAALYNMFTHILQDKGLNKTIFIVDALDECETGLSGLLDLIHHHPPSSRIKWIISSRNISQIEQSFRVNRRLLRLDLEQKKNAKAVSQAVDRYMKHSLSKLPSIRNDIDLQHQLQEEMRKKANKTFLWVSFVIKELRKELAWNLLDTVKIMPPDLKALYRRSVKQIEKLNQADSDHCKRFLSAVCTAYRPLRLVELGVLSGLPSNISENLQSVETVLTLCGSLLTLRGADVYFIHQSAKEYLFEEESKTLFPTGIGAAHYSAFSLSLQVMSKTLKRSIYGLRHPGTSINDFESLEIDPLSAVRYSCIYWIDHLDDAVTHKAPIPSRQHDLHNGTVYNFLSEKYLCWLEALGLLRAVPKGVAAMMRLERLLEEISKAFLSFLTHDRRLPGLVQDGRRFIQSYGGAIAIAPLQAYLSALNFSPEGSIVRRLCNDETPKWMSVIFKRPFHWDEVDDGRGMQRWSMGCVTSVVFSPNGPSLASASQDRSVKIWNTTTGSCEATLHGHRSAVTALAFSPDGGHLASASIGGDIKLWDVKNRRCDATLDSIPIMFTSVAFSPDSRRLAAGSLEGICIIWDATTRKYERTLQGHGGLLVKDRVHSVTFSPDSQLLASASGGGTVKIWDVTTGDCEATLVGHGGWLGLGAVNSVAYSPDGQHLASGAVDRTVKIWNATTGICEATLQDHTDQVTSVAFSSNGEYLVSGSEEGTVNVWDVANRTCKLRLMGDGSRVTSVASSPDNQYLASASEAGIIKIWDAITGAREATLTGHGGNEFTMISVSPDGQFFTSLETSSRSHIWSVKIQNVKTGLSGKIFSEGIPPTSMDFSTDSRHLAVIFDNDAADIWSAATGKWTKVQDIKRKLFPLKIDGLDTQILTLANTIRLTVPSSLSNDSLSPPDPPNNPHQSYGISSDGIWITYKDRNLLWLPSQYRPREIAIGSSLILLRCHSQQLMQIQINEEELCAEIY